MVRKSTFFVVAVLLAAIVFVSAYPAPAGQPVKGSDRVLSSRTFIHFRKAHVKPPWAGGGGGGKPGGKDQGYYTYLSKGAKWKTVEEFRLNANCGENASSAPKALIAAAVAAGMSEWETHAGADVFDAIVDNELVSYKDGAYRGWNTISFGDYGDPNVIGVARVWGYFSGKPDQREIIEAHIQLNDPPFEWGDATVDGDGDGSPDHWIMDVQNILTHELGHAAGMGDVYQPEAGEETMYGYSGEGETKKRDLYTGDKTGIGELYE